tara:strand:+ start:280 stop:660 length:381 start_codon:yes stop_codon:yes gene_type:complete
MINKNISRDDIADTINKEFGFSRKECLDIVNDIIEIIIKSLIDEDNNIYHDKDDPKGKYKKGEFKCRLVKIHNFGTFTLRKKNSRIGRNPKTKEEVLINDRNVISFKASKNILKYINQNETTDKEL